MLLILSTLGSVIGVGSATENEETMGEIGEINDWKDLDNIRNDLNSHYELRSHLDEDSDGYDDLVDTENGWEPIGDENAPFTGNFIGGDHKIKDLYIDREDTDDVGLFGHIDNANITGVGVVDANVTGGNNVGALVGRMSSGGVYHSNTSWDETTNNIVTGDNNVGGLIGYNHQGIVETSYAIGDVEGDLNIGGLIGVSEGGIVYKSYAASFVESSSNSVGGLVGRMNDSGRISESYAKGVVDGHWHVGGLVGNCSGVISNSYATGDVSGHSYVGGLVGLNWEGHIIDTYATGNVSGSYDVGGLVGKNGPQGIVLDSFSLDSPVIGDGWEGSGRVTSAPKEEMKDYPLYTNESYKDYDDLEEPWDFVGSPGDDKGNDLIWDMDEDEEKNDGFPYLAFLPDGEIESEYEGFFLYGLEDEVAQEQPNNTYTFIPDEFAPSIEKVDFEFGEQNSTVTEPTDDGEWVSDEFEMWNETSDTVVEVNVTYEDEEIGSVTYIEKPTLLEIEADFVKTMLEEYGEFTVHEDYWSVEDIAPDIEDLFPDFYSDIMIDEEKDVPPELEEFGIGGGQYLLDLPGEDDIYFGFSINSTEDLGREISFLKFEFEIGTDPIDHSQISYSHEEIPSVGFSLELSGNFKLGEENITMDELPGLELSGEGSFSYSTTVWAGKIPITITVAPRVAANLIPRFEFNDDAKIDVNEVEGGIGGGVQVSSGPGVQKGNAGGYVDGELMTHYEGQIDERDIAFKNATMDAEIGLYAEVLGFRGEIDFWDGEWVYTPEEGGSWNTLLEDGDEWEWEPIKREWLDEEYSNYTWTEGQTEGRLVKQIFNNPQPSIAVSEDGKRVAAWSHDDPDQNPDEERVNRSLEIAYSFYNQDKQNWSQPEILTNEGEHENYSDVNPELTYLGDGRVMAVWQRVTNEDSEIDTELAYSIYDPTIEEWSEPELLTPNEGGEGIDTASALVNQGNQTILVWTRNVESDPFSSHNLTLLISEWNDEDEEWTDPAEIENDLTIIGDPDLALASEDEGMLAFARDMDDDLNTADDREIFVATYDGNWSSPERLTNNQVEDARPSLAPRGEEWGISWIRRDPIEGIANRTTSFICFAELDKNGTLKSETETLLKNQTVSNQHLLKHPRGEPSLVYQSGLRGEPTVLKREKDEEKNEYRWSEVANPNYGRTAEVAEDRISYTHLSADMNSGHLGIIAAEELWNETGTRPYETGLFTGTEKYDLAVNIEGSGTVVVDNGTGRYEEIPDKTEYQHGNEVTLVALPESAPDSDWYFTNWTGDIPEDETKRDLMERKITITMDDDKNITANFEEFEEDDYKVTNWEELYKIRYSSSDFILMNDLDESTYGYEEYVYAEDKQGWEPIGRDYGIQLWNTRFNGAFDGNGYEIRDLYINHSRMTSVGLFSRTDNGAEITSVEIVDADVNGEKNVGILIGFNGASLKNSSATGQVSGNSNVGGLVGVNAAPIENSYMIGDVNGEEYVGGLVGYTYGTTYATVFDSYAVGNVSGNNSVGGLVGWSMGPVSNSYAAGNVSGNNSVGGLVGENEDEEVFNSYATGKVSGEEYVGGLIGRNYEATVSNSYATGNVSGNNSVGGLVGDNQAGDVVQSFANGSVNGNNSVGGFIGENYGSVKNSYATGNVSGNNSVGGLVGWNHREVNNAYARGNVSGNNSVGGLVGYNIDFGSVYDSFSLESPVIGVEGGIQQGRVTDAPESEMKDYPLYTQISYSDYHNLSEPWDFVGNPCDDEGDEDIWDIDEEGIIKDGYPFLRWEVQNILYVSISGEQYGSVEVEGQEVSHGWYDHFKENEIINLTAIPDENHLFERWKVVKGDYSYYDEENITITMDDDIYIWAYFEDYPELTIQIEGEGSTEPKEGKHTYNRGEEVTVTATPDDGWYHKEWTGDTDEVGREITVIMDEHKEITAHFGKVKENESVLTIWVEGDGTTDPLPGDHTYEVGTGINIESTADEGWTLSHWSGDVPDSQYKLQTLDLVLDEHKSVTAHFTDSSWPMFGYDQYRTGRSPVDTSHIKGEERWAFETGDSIVSSPVMDGDDTIYVGSDDGNLYAVYPNGTERWNYSMGDNVRSTPAVVGNDGTIYVGSMSELPPHGSSLNAIYPNGTKKWSYFMGYGGVHSSPSISADGTVYIGSNDNRLYAVDSEDGTEEWNFTTGDEVWSSPAIGRDGTIYVGSNDNNLYAVYPTNGTEKWSFTTEDNVSSSPAVGGDGTIYVGSDDGNLYAVYPNGTERWNYSMGDNVRSTPAVVGNDGTIYVGSMSELPPHGSSLNAIYPNGTKKWSYFMGYGGVHSSPSISADGTVYIGSNDNRLYAVDSEDGTEEWNFTTGDEVWSSPSIGSDGAIYFGSNDGNLYAIGPSLVEDWYDLDEIRYDLEETYVLGNDLDSGSSGYDDLVDTPDGWNPIGNSAEPFTGRLYGLDNTISDLYIDRPTEDRVGLFGYAGSEAVIENVNLQSVNITGRSRVGSLAGESYGEVVNSAATGTVHAEGSDNSLVGGLIGLKGSTGTVEDSEAAVNVTGNEARVGGLVGDNYGTILDSSAAGEVYGGDDNVGGLVGLNWGDVKRSYATGDVEAYWYHVGGLVGRNYGGHEDYEPLIENCYATGDVFGDDWVGGLVGENYESGATIRDSYSTGEVGALWFYVGGLVGENYYGEVTDSFWDVETSGIDYSDGGTGLTTEEMQDVTTFEDAGWNITAVYPGETEEDYVWNILGGYDYPTHSWDETIDPAVFVLDDWSVHPDQVETNETVTIEGKVTNIGGEEDSDWIDLYIDDMDTWIDDEYITLSPGESTWVNFTGVPAEDWNFDKIGIHDVKVSPWDHPAEWYGELEVYFYEDFEDTEFPPSGWYADEEWYRTTDDSYSGNASAKIDFSLDYQEELLMTPWMEVSDNTTLYFWERSDWVDYYDEHHYVGVYDEDGVWTWYSLPDAEEEWREWYLELDDWAGEEIRIGFYYEGEDGTDWYVDDVAVVESEWGNTTDLSGHEVEDGEMGDSMSERDIAGPGDGSERDKDRSEDRDGGGDSSESDDPPERGKERSERREPPGAEKREERVS
ncbi:MAG: PQQ-binding-like beta-propeller repeat protein [Candidatus Aenigmatarchaeota archaeon]